MPPPAPDVLPMPPPDDPPEPPPLALVVDDREANRYIVARTLRGAGFAVAEAVDGAGALRLAAERVPAVILLDVNLPDLSGFEVARRLKADPAARVIPILQVSASHVSTAQQAAGLDAGADAYLTHPIDPGVLLATVNALLRVRRAEDAARRSAERLRATLDSVAVPFHLLDREWRYVHVNEEAVRAVGLPRAAMLGRTVWEVFPAVVGTTFEQEYRRAVATGRPAVFTDFYAPLDTWFEIHAQPTAEGGLAINFLDVTDRQRAAEELRASEERYRFLAESMPQIVWTGTPDGSLDYFSGNLATFTGAHDPERLLHDRWKEGIILHPDDVAATVACWQRSVETGEDYECSHRVRGADGGYRWFLSRAVPMRGADGAVRRWFGTSTDVDDLTRAQENLTRARDEAEAANRSKDEFLATLSHELRTPLNAILGWAHLIALSPDDPETRREGLGIIERNTRAQVRLIEDLLDVSRITSGKLRLEVRPVDLAAVVGAALDAVRPAAEARGVRVDAVLDPRAGPVSGDPDRLQQVAWNLLSNAIKFTPRGGKVQARLERINSHLEIVVADTGQGIPPEFLPHVFERFRQADSSSTRPYQGLGLGLAITRHLAEIHGGSVHAASAGPGQGATFTVRLPPLVARPETPPAATGAAAAAHVHLGAEEVALPPAAPAAEAVTPGELAGVRVLAVDDDPDARTLLGRILGRQGAEVRLAGSASEGFELAAGPRGQFEVILCDLEMPGEDGYGFVRRLRALPIERGGGTPVVALTAYARGEDRTRVLRAGFDLHLPKPVAPAELVAVVASLARRRR